MTKICCLCNVQFDYKDNFRENYCKLSQFFSIKFVENVVRWPCWSSHNETVNHQYSAILIAWNNSMKTRSIFLCPLPCYPFAHPPLVGGGGQGMHSTYTCRVGYWCLPSLLGFLAELFIISCFFFFLSSASCSAILISFFKVFNLL